MGKNNVIAIILFSILLNVSCSTKDKLPSEYIPIVYAGYIFIQGYIDDTVQTNLLLDTGAENIYIDSFFFQEKHLKYNNMDSVEVIGIGNSIQKIPLIKDSVRVSFGKYRHTATDIPILQLKPIGGDFIDGLFGLHYLQDDILKINYYNNYIARYPDISKIITKVEDSEYSKLDLQQIAHLYCVPLSFKVNDTLTIKGDFVIDVGVPITTITSVAAKKYNFSETISEKIEYFTKYGGVGGESAGYDFIAKSVKIGNYTLDKINMSYSLDEGGFLAQDDYIGILGNNILEKFDLIFDFEQNAFYVKPNQSFYEEFKFDKLGFTYVDRTKTKGGWIVTGLSKGSEAAEKLQIDDKIIAINKRPVKNIPLQIQKTYFNNMDKVELTIENDNKVRQVSLTLIPLL